MFITCKIEWVHKSASNNSHITRACCLSNIGWWWTWWAWRPCSPTFNTPKATWPLHKVASNIACAQSYLKHGLCTKLPQTLPLHKVASKNNHKSTRLISLVFNSFLWIKALPNLLSWFHHIVECVETLHLLQHTILKLVTTIDIFWTER